MATLDFKGKALVQNYHLTVKYHELVPKKDKSLTDRVRLDDNLIIHGDNLKALKALLPTYAGKVKCIYIDPPYNTGNEGWVYNDNVNSPMIQEWLGKTIDRDDLTRHDKWLCMMTPRLKLLRELLTLDGGIFISIDDNEVHNLRLLMDEVFPRGRQSDRFVATLHEYCICYARNLPSLELNGLALTSDDLEGFDQEDTDGKRWRELGLRQRGSGSLREDRPDMYFPIYVSAKDGTVSLQKSKLHAVEVVPQKSDGRDGRWMWSPKKVETEISRVYGRLVSGREEYDIFIKDYLDRAGEQRTTKPKSMWLDGEVNTEAGGKLLKKILGEKSIDYPKPTGLIRRVVQIATDPNSIVLDAFAGSGTTGHAVLEVNQDGGSRQFILIESEDYADSLTAERTRRVIKGIRGVSDDALRKGLGGTFSYFELGKAIELDSILDGKNLPSYLELARYVFYTATGEEFDERKVNEKRQFVGESRTHEVYLFYKPDIDHLKKTALTLERAEEFGKPKANGKRRLVFAPTKYLDQEQLDALRIDFAQLPFEIYKLAR